MINIIMSGNQEKSKIMYQCDMCNKSYTSKYGLISHARAKPSITVSSQEAEQRRQTVEVNQFESIDNPLEEIEDYLFEDTADAEFIEALNFEEFNYIVANMKDDFEVSETNSQEEAKAKKYKKKKLCWSRN